MLNRIIDLTLAYRWLVLVGILALLGAGGYALYTIPVEAFPDLTNNQVVVVTDAPSLPPTEVEQLVTYPIERAMLGLPNKQEVRSLSKLGLSMVTIVFDDSVADVLCAAAGQRAPAADLVVAAARDSTVRWVCPPQPSASSINTRFPGR